MNEEQLREYTQRILAETDPQKQSLLINDLTFMMNPTAGLQQPSLPASTSPITSGLNPGNLPTLENTYNPASSSSVVPPVNLPPSAFQPLPNSVANPPTTPTIPSSTAGRTAGDVTGQRDPNKPVTVADFLTTLETPGVQSASMSVPGPNYAEFMRTPTVNIPMEMFGQTVRDLTSQSILQRQDLINQIDQEEAAAREQARQYRSGELQVQRSGLADMIEIASTPEDFARIKASGKIPVAARDAQLIIENARKEAEAITRAAEQGVQVAAVNQRQLARRQIGAGIGAAFTAGLNRTDFANAELSTIRTQAEQARQELLRNMDRKRSSQVEADRLNSRAQIDAMVARLEPMQAISQLIQADAMDTFQRQVQAEREAVAKAENARMRREQILLSDPQFKASLAGLAATAYTPLPGQFIQPNASQLKAGMGSAEMRGVNQVIMARAKSTATAMEAHIKSLQEHNNMNTDNDLTIKNIDLFVAETDGVIKDAFTLKAAGGILPEAERVVDSLIAMRNQLIQMKNSGDASWFGIGNAENQVENAYNNPNSELNRNLGILKNSDILIDGSTSPATGAAPTKLDFKSKGY